MYGFLFIYFFFHFGATSSMYRHFISNAIQMFLSLIFFFLFYFVFILSSSTVLGFFFLLSIVSLFLESFWWPQNEPLFSKNILLSATNKIEWINHQNAVFFFYTRILLFWTLLFFKRAPIVLLFFFLDSPAQLKQWKEKRIDEKIGMQHALTLNVLLHLIYSIRLQFVLMICVAIVERIF